MGGMTSQITSLAIVYSTVYSGADQRKHQSPASLAFVRGIPRGPVISPHKWPVTRKLLPFDDVIMISQCWHRPMLPYGVTMLGWVDEQILVEIIPSQYNTHNRIPLTEPVYNTLSNMPYTNAFLFHTIRNAPNVLTFLQTTYLFFFPYIDFNSSQVCLQGSKWQKVSIHYSDGMMSTMASQITSLTIVYSTVYSDADERKHQSSASLAFVRGIHRWPWIPRTKGQ